MRLPGLDEMNAKIRTLLQPVVMLPHWKPRTTEHTHIPAEKQDERIRRKPWLHVHVQLLHSTIARETTSLDDDSGGRR